MEMDQALAEARAPYARLLEVCRTALDMIDDARGDVATAFTCTEADAIAAAMDAVGIDSDSFLAAHAEDDDEGDRHRVCAECEGSGRFATPHLSGITHNGSVSCGYCNGAGWKVNDDAE